MTSVGVPIKILHEAEGHVVTLETVTGEVYRGKLLEAEDNMNCQMAEVCVTFRDGRTHQLDNVFVRGNKIRFMILPDMLKNAPMFKNIGRAQKGAIGMGMGGDPRGGRGGRGTSFRARGAAMARGGVRGAVRGGPGGFRGNRIGDFETRLVIAVADEYHTVMSAFNIKRHQFLTYQAAALYAIVFIFVFVKLGSVEAELEENSAYDLATHCYHKYWKYFNLENFLDLLPFIAERCAPSPSVMDVYRFGDEDDWRYSMIPKAAPPQKKCYAFVFVGFSHGLAVELQIKRSLLFNCDMMGVHPAASDTAHDFALNIGEFEQARVQSWNGMSSRSLATIVANNVDYARNSQHIIAEHVFVTEIDDIYELLPRMLEEVGYSRYIVSCQLTIDIPRPDARQIQLFISFIQQIITEEHYTILSVLDIRNVMRIHMFNHHHNVCIKRYGSWLRFTFDHVSQVSEAGEFSCRVHSGYQNRAQLWLSFHAVVNECTTRKHLVLHRYHNKKFDIDHVKTAIHAGNCTIAFYGLSESLSAELSLCQEEQNCQLYGIDSNKNQEIDFKKIGKFFEAKSNDVDMADKTHTSERRKREEIILNDERSGFRKVPNSIEEDEKFTKKHNKEENLDRIRDSKKNLKTITDLRRHKEVSELKASVGLDVPHSRQNDKEVHRDAAHPSVISLQKHNEPPQNMDKKGKHINNVTVIWDDQSDEQNGKKKDRKLAKEVGETKEVEQSSNVEDKVDKRADYLKKYNAGPNSAEEKAEKKEDAKDSEQTLEKKREKGPEERKETTVTGDEKSEDLTNNNPGNRAESKNVMGKVDKRADYLIKYNRGPSSDEIILDRKKELKKAEQLLEQKRERASKKIEETMEMTSTPTEDFATKKPGNSVPTKSLDKDHQKSANGSDALESTTISFDKETFGVNNDDDKMIEDDQDYVMQTTLSTDVHEIPKEILSVDLETFILKNVRKRLIYQLSINVANGFYILEELAKKVLKSIDICQINIILLRPSNKNLEQFALFHKHIMENTGLLPLIAEEKNENIRIYLLNTSSWKCLELYSYNGVKPKS
ncbi:hypothetical protein RB195_003239 [Necator americanus]|uniref:Small nuclear ribonucleoprotein Sm D3 n=4 Tax=Strongyloidea TaxID=27829 RepID=A0ABR1DMN6_NECAM